VISWFQSTKFAFKLNLYRYTPAPPITPGADGLSIIIPEPKLGDGGQYVINLPGGGYLDGAEHAREARRAAAAGLCAGWSCAALANHPPKGVTPNVEAIPVDWSEWQPPATADPTAAPTTAPTADAAAPAADPVEFADSVARKLVNPTATAPWYVDGATVGALHKLNPVDP
jgi:hypothetical protein